MDLDRNASWHVWQHSEGVVASIIYIHNQQYMDELHNRSLVIILVILHCQLISEDFLSVSEPDARAKTGCGRSVADAQVDLAGIHALYSGEACDVGKYIP